MTRWVQIEKTTMKLILLLGFCFYSICAPAALETIEQELIANVKKNKQSQIDFIEKTVNINSGTFNLKGVKEVGKVYAQAFLQLGLKTKWIDLPQNMQRAGHLLAYTTGKKGKKILLIGHLDTVFDEKSPFQRFKTQGNIAKGPGVIDIKGGNAIILYALKALKEAHLLDDMAITIILTGDEESPGLPTHQSRAQLIKLGNQSDIVLAFESANNLHEVVTARRGLAKWNLTVNAKGGHSSLIFTPEFGEGAILTIAKILESLANMAKSERYLTLNPGLIVGGSKISDIAEPPRASASGKINIIASKAYATGEIRYLAKNNLRGFIQMGQALAKQQPSPINASFTQDKISTYPAMELSKQNIRLLDELAKTNLRLGFGSLRAIDPRKKGGADIAYIDKAIPKLDGLGAIGQFDHSEAEMMDIAKTIDATSRLAVFLYQISRHAPK
jgi:glutamate carboxypeptidase